MNNPCKAPSGYGPCACSGPGCQWWHKAPGPVTYFYVIIKDWKQNNQKLVHAILHVRNALNIDIDKARKLIKDNVTFKIPDEKLGELTKNLKKSGYLLQSHPEDW